MQTEKQRERLVEMRDRLVDFVKRGGVIIPETAESVADYLLKNGVIFPKVKAGGNVYRVVCSEFRKPWIWHWEIIEIMIYPDEIVYRDDSDNIITDDDFGKTVFLSRAEAEAKLKEMFEEKAK